MYILLNKTLTLPLKSITFFLLKYSLCTVLYATGVQYSVFLKVILHLQSL